MKNHFTNQNANLKQTCNLIFRTSRGCEIARVTNPLKAPATPKAYCGSWTSLLAGSYPTMPSPGSYNPDWSKCHSVFNIIINDGCSNQWIQEKYQVFYSGFVIQMQYKTKGAVNNIYNAFSSCGKSIWQYYINPRLLTINIDDDNFVSTALRYKL